MVDWLATSRVHCSGANLGPGFDNAAVAYGNLILHADAELTARPGLQIKFTGRYKFPTGDRSRPRKVYEAIKADFPDMVNAGLNVYFRNNIKDGGLGTSGANCVQMAELMNHFYQLGLSQKQIAGYAAKGEPGHSDNVSASTWGGVVFTKEYAERAPFEFEPHKIPKGIIPALVIPVEIEKDGGTEKARKAINAQLMEEEIAFRNSLYRKLVTGFDTDNFEIVKDAIDRYSRWMKSVTKIRNDDKVYKMDVFRLMSELERIVGAEVVLTPSGAGPVMLILAKNSGKAEEALDVAVHLYKAEGHTVETLVTSFHDSHPRILD